MRPCPTPSIDSSEVAPASEPSALLHASNVKSVRLNSELAAPFKHPASDDVATACGAHSRHEAKFALPRDPLRLVRAFQGLLPGIIAVRV
jgi:hypothetical protein